MDEKTFLDELSTFPEWRVFGKEISEELNRRINDEEISENEDEWCTLDVFEDIVESVNIKDEMISFIAKLAKMKFDSMLDEYYEKEWNKTMEAIKNGKRLHS